MAFWPIWWCIAGGLTCWGAMVGGGAWRVPAALLFGYMATRGAMWAFDPPLQAQAVASVWFSVALVLVIVSAYLPAILVALSALVYPLFALVGLNIGWLSVASILGDVLCLLALGIAGGGIYERSNRYGENHNGSRAGCGLSYALASDKDSMEAGG